MDTELLEAKKTAYRLCQTTNIVQAFQRIEAEREQTADIQDRYTALTIHIQRIDALLRTANQIVSEIPADMFTPKTLTNLIESYKRQWLEMQPRLQEALRL